MESRLHFEFHVEMVVDSTTGGICKGETPRICVLWRATGLCV